MARVVIDEDAITVLLTSPAGPVGAYMARGGAAVAAGAKKRAPVGENSRTPLGHPSGYLRSGIDWDVHVEGREVVATIETTALTSQANPFPDEPYSLFQESPAHQPTPHAKHWGTHPYLVPALDDWPPA